MTSTKIQINLKFQLLKNQTNYCICAVWVLFFQTLSIICYLRFVIWYLSQICFKYPAAGCMLKSFYCSFFDLSYPLPCKFKYLANFFQ